MKYPNDYKPFEGKVLSSKEINKLIHSGLKRGVDAVAMCDIMVEFDEDKNITVWQHKAYYKSH